MSESSLTLRLKELAGLFLKLGLMGFGGPGAHMAWMHKEVVRRRQWLTNEDFFDLVSAAHLIPGPSSTEMALYIGFRRAGWAGLVIGGGCFILPAMLIVMILARLYIRFGSTIHAEGILYGVKPVIIAVMVQALWDLSQKAVKGMLTGIAGFAVLVLYFFGIHELALLLASGLIVMIGENIGQMKTTTCLSLMAPAVGLGLPLPAMMSFDLPLMFFKFLKIGSVLFGSGYVLLAFLKADFVIRLGWLTDQQLLDAMAIGLIAPGPMLTTATFIGFTLGGAPAALAATVGIFLPSFVFVAVSNPILSRLRQSVWTNSLLNGVNAAAAGLIAAVACQFARSSLTDPFTIGITCLSTILMFGFKLNPAWLLCVAGIAGWFYHH